MRVLADSTERPADVRRLWTGAVERLGSRGGGGLPQAITIVVVVAAVAAAFYLAVTTSGFLTIDNLKAVLTSASLVGILAVGMTLIVISGNLFSLSLGITAAVSAMFFLNALPLGVWPAIALTLAFAAAVCALQGLLVGGIGANPIIVTIGAGAVQQGVALWLTDGRSVLAPGSPDSYEFLTQPLLGIPFVVYVFVAVVIAGQIVLSRGRFGHQIYLLGESRQAALAAGFPITRLVTKVFGGAGLCAGVAGVLLGAGSGHADLGLEGTLTFDSLAAVLIGGSAISGGRGSMVRTALGAIAIATVTDIFLLRGYSQGIQVLVTGLAVGIVVVLTQLNRSEARS